MIFRSRAPVRVDFAGGWTDVALFAEDSPGAVVNAALNIFSYATLIPGKEGEPSGNRVQIYSSDYDTYVEAEDVKKLEYDGNVDLVKAAIRRLSARGGFEIITQSTAPAGSGLGTSASMGVALIGALTRYAGKALLPYEVAEMASAIEQEELKIRGGKQDHYTSALGGFRFLEFFGGRVQQSPLELSRDVLLELEKNSVLCYTGKSRLSGDIHKSVADAYSSGERETRGAIDGLKQVGIEMKEALLSGSLEDYARLLDENWVFQKELHASVTNAEIEGLMELARREGALAGKACGAGGGGCLLFYCNYDKQHQVQRALEEKGIRIIDFQFEPQGLRTWAVSG